MLLGNIRKGFTMIELLVVIAVIGILAVALLATLNPLEQIRKGRDTQSRTDASQLISALERYNASIGYFPWEGKPGNQKTITWADLAVASPMRTDDADCPGSCNPSEVLAELTNTNEVKSGFVDRIVGKTNPIYLHYAAGTASSVYACFKPESNTFAREAFDRCVSGTWPSDADKVHACPRFSQNYTGQTFDAAAAAELICLP